MLSGKVPDPCYADDECRRRVTDEGLRLAGGVWSSDNMNLWCFAVQA